MQDRSSYQAEEVVLGTIGPNVSNLIKASSEIYCVLRSSMQEAVEVCGTLQILLIIEKRNSL